LALVICGYKGQNVYQFIIYPSMLSGFTSLQDPNRWMAIVEPIQVSCVALRIPYDSIFRGCKKSDLHTTSRV